tara:strand:+ start:7654 stop:8355 length:702 start_codon:yes stop_codon:yes gene_type:complete
MTFLIKQVNQLNQYTIMGLSNGSSEGTVYLKLKGMRQEDAYPFLTRTVKKDDKWTTEGEWKQISGQLKSIKFKTFTSEKYGDKESLYLEIVDDAIYNIEISTGSALSRSIINSLAGTKKIDLIELGFYTQTKNDRSFKRAFVKLNGEDKSPWALSIDEQKSLTTVIEDPDTGDVIKRKYDKLLSKLKELCNPECNFNAQPRVTFEQATTSLDTHMSAPKQAPKQEEEIDDLPF